MEICLILLHWFVSLDLVQPDEIYNLAAQSHVQVSFDVPEYSGDVDAIGVLRILEACPHFGTDAEDKDLSGIHI